MKNNSNSILVKNGAITTPNKKVTILVKPGKKVLL